MRLTKLVLGVIFSFSVSLPLSAEYDNDVGKSDGSNADLSTLDNDASFEDSQQKSPGKDSKLSNQKQPPLKPYPRLLPLRLISPSSVNVGESFEGVNVNLRNPGNTAPNARLRLLLHETDHRKFSENQKLSPNNVKLELLEKGVWEPVELGVVEGGIMGAIGYEGQGIHRERYHRGGFTIPSGMNKTWQLRLTINIPGTYTLVAAVSPDNGSRHIAKPAHSVIVVQ